MLEQGDKALDNAMTIKRKRIMIYFIEATEKLIREEGVSGLSIRKIAAEAGYNSATIYNYFNDLEQLVMFGSVYHLRDYIAALERELRPDMPAIDQYRTIYRCFNYYAFRSPSIYHNLFFGQYGDRLGSVLHLYYHELFPEVLARFSPRMQQMLMGGNMRERDRYTMERMVQEGDVSADRADAALELVVALHQSFIYEATLGGEDFDPDAHQKRFEQLFEYILATAKQ